jgi:membrane protease YdiL (CAAX protease family)
MFGPAVAHVVTRTVTDEGWNLTDTLLSPQIRQGWPYWAIAWVAPTVLTLLGAAVYFLAFSDTYAGMEGVSATIRTLGGQTDQPEWLTAEVVVAVQLVAALTFGVVINSIFTFGEEFGWRGYLLPKLLPMGPRRAMVVMGVIWGVWHWPLTLIGHNYGLNYPFAPIPGMLVMLWFTTVLGIFFAWVTLRGGSVWPAVIGHAAINAIAGIGLLFATDPLLLLGPAPSGLVGSIPFALLAAWILLDEDRLAPPDFETATDAGVGPDSPSTAGDVASSGESGSSGDESPTGN